jgi:hypothetical protein
MVSEIESLALRKYLALFRVFAEGNMTGEAFYTVFFPMYAEEPITWSPAIYAALQQAFWAAEDYTPERAGTPGFSSEQDFRAEIGTVVDQLAELGARN